MERPQSCYQWLDLRCPTKTSKFWPPHIHYIASKGAGLYIYCRFKSTPFSGRENFRTEKLFRSKTQTRRRDATTAPAHPPPQKHHVLRVPATRCADGRRAWSCSIRRTARRSSSHSSCSPWVNNTTCHSSSMKYTYLSYTNEQSDNQ